MVRYNSYGGNDVVLDVTRVGPTRVGWTNPGPSSKYSKDRRCARIHPCQETT